MKTKEQILSMLMENLTEYRYKLKLLETEANSDYREVLFSTVKYLAIRIRLLYDILGEEVPEEYWDELEEI